MAKIKITGGPTRKVRITGTPSMQVGGDTRALWNKTHEGVQTTPQWDHDIRRANAGVMPIQQEFADWSQGKAGPLLQKAISAPHGISKVDDWEGYQTGAYKYIPLTVVNQHTGAPDEVNHYGMDYERGIRNNDLYRQNQMNPQTPMDMRLNDKPVYYYNQPVAANIPNPGRQPQQGNWHTDENTDYSVDAVRARMGGYMQYGGQNPPDQWGKRNLNTFWTQAPGNLQGQPDEYKVGKVLPEAEPGQGDIEAEKNEQVLGDFNGDGTPALMDVSGPPHTQGGKEVEVPDNSFVFSDTKQLKIKDKDILKNFNMPVKKRGGYTPAQVAKQYDVQKYTSKLADPATDPVTRKTAEMMVKNYLVKLQQLSEVQENMKNQMGIGDNQQPQMPMQYGGKKGQAPMTQVFDAQDRMSFVPDTPGYDPTFSAGRFSPGTPDPNYQPDMGTGMRKTDTGYGKSGEGVFRFDQEPVDITKQFDINPLNFGNNIQANQEDVTAGTPTTLGNMAAGAVKGAATGAQQDSTIPLQKQDRRFTRPDQLGLLNSALNYATLHKYLPYEPPVTGVIPQTTFLDPTRALAANSEQANQAYQGVAHSANPQANMANFSAIQGQAGKQAADILGQYANQNVQISNQANAQAAQITNGILEAQRNRLKALHQGNTIAAQQYDNAEREARADLLNVYTNAWKNRQGYNDLNQTNQLFQRDPNTGFMVFSSPQAKATFMKNISGQPGGTGSGGKTYNDWYDYFNNTLKLNPDDAKDAAVEAVRKQSGLTGRERTTTDAQNRVKSKVTSEPTLPKQRYGGPFSPLGKFTGK